MAGSNNDAVKDAAVKIEATITQLKAWLEDIITMRVECAKLEFDILSLYHTVCPEVLDGVREDLLDVNIEQGQSNQDNNIQ